PKPLKPKSANASVRHDTSKLKYRACPRRPTLAALRRQPRIRILRHPSVRVLVPSRRALRARARSRAAVDSRRVRSHRLPRAVVRAAVVVTTSVLVAVVAAEELAVVAAAREPASPIVVAVARRASAEPSIRKRWMRTSRRRWPRFVAPRRAARRATCAVVLAR